MATNSRRSLETINLDSNNSLSSTTLIDNNKDSKITTYTVNILCCSFLVIVLFCNFPLTSYYIYNYNSHLNCYNNTECIKPYLLDKSRQTCLCPSNYTCGQVCINATYAYGTYEDCLDYSYFCYYDVYDGDVEVLYDNCHAFLMHDVNLISNYYTYFFNVSSFVIVVSIMFTIVTFILSYYYNSIVPCIMTLLCLLAIGIKIVELFVTIIMLSEYQIYTTIECTNLASFFGILYRAYWFLTNLLTVFGLPVWLGLVIIRFSVKRNMWCH